MTETKYDALKAAVYTRGIPPDSFLDELIEWGRQAPDEIFAPNDKADIYGSVKNQLGPWTGIFHRKAAMLEVLRVLAGFESSWHWNEGRDITNSTSGTPWTEETGIFQVSANATDFDKSLSQFVVATIGKFAGPFASRYHNGFDCRKFIVEMKANHKFAIEFAARLLRFTTKHNGPVARREINPWLSRDAVEEFEGFLAAF
jgi:hypothetical protein